jgi:Fe-S-cluster containining protein
MLIPLGKDENGADHFGCNFLDTETRKCTIYAQRPKMCRSFPYGRACPFCTYDDRQPEVPGVLREQFHDPEPCRPSSSAIGASAPGGLRPRPPLR